MLEKYGTGFGLQSCLCSHEAVHHGDVVGNSFEIGGKLLFDRVDRME